MTREEHLSRLDKSHHLHVLYHATCTDGSAAAWVIQQTFPEHKITFQEIQYGYEFNELEQISYCDLIVVDFCLTEIDTIELSERVNSITVIDHHDTRSDYLVRLINEGIIFGTYDVAKSGALLAWEYFNPQISVPQLIEHVSDRDLFNFHLADTKSVITAAKARGSENGVEHFAKLAQLPVERLKEEGSPLCEFKQACLASIARDVFWLDTEHGLIPAANTTKVFASDMGEFLYTKKQIPYAALISINKTGFGLSLRSKKNQGIAVKSIAEEKFNGGGHKYAAGGQFKHISELGNYNFEISINERYPSDEPPEADTSDPLIRSFIENCTNNVIKLKHNIYFRPEETPIPACNTPACLEVFVAKKLFNNPKQTPLVCTYRAISNGNIMYNFWERDNEQIGIKFTLTHPLMTF